MKMNTLVPTRCFFRLLPFSVEPRMRIRKKAKRIHRKTPRTTNQMKKRMKKNDEDKKSREKEWKEKGTVSMYGIVCCVWCACADLSINKFHLRYKKLHLCIFLVPLVWHGAFFALVLSLHPFFHTFQHWRADAVAAVSSRKLDDRKLMLYFFVRFPSHTRFPLICFNSNWVTVVIVVCVHIICNLCVFLSKHIPH